MFYVILGAIGFVLLLAFDLSSMKNHIVLKYLFGLLGLVAIMYSTFALFSMTTDMVIAPIVRYISYVLALIFFALLIYSVFIEVGGNTYEKIAKPELVTDGTYSLVRHPGVIWLFLMYFFASIFFENSIITTAAIVWTIVNSLYIMVQEELVLKKIFANYDEYRRSTPMLIPSYASFKKFITIENWRK